MTGLEPVEFQDWFQKKRDEGSEALVFSDEQGIGSFIYLKVENEPIELTDKTLPSKARIKIGTFRIADRYRRQRLGEGALGVSLWRWQEEKCEEIYLTIFDKHTELIGLFERFGFKCVGYNKRRERVYYRSRLQIDYSDPYLAFPFIRPDFEVAGLIPIYEKFHDRLLPYSEVKGNKRIIEEETAGNGITKVYIATPTYAMQYAAGEPVVIYRISEQQKGRTYRSAVTSFCTITKEDVIKDKGNERVSLADFIDLAGNKTVFSREELTNIFSRDSVVMLEFVYNGFFGKGHNVTHKELSDQGLFNAHPYQIEYSKEQLSRIIRMGDRDVQNIIID